MRPLMICPVLTIAGVLLGGLIGFVIGLYVLCTADFSGPEGAMGYNIFAVATPLAFIGGFSGFCVGAVGSAIEFDKSRQKTLQEKKISKDR